MTIIHAKQEGISILKKSENQLKSQNKIKNSNRDCTYCICPICGEKVYNKHGLICHEVHCPKCKALMVRN